MTHVSPGAPLCYAMLRYFNVGDKTMGDDDLKKSYDALLGCVGAKHSIA